MMIIDEAALQERDERCATLIESELAYYTFLELEAEYAAREARRNIRRIEEAVQQEAWYKLRNILNSEDIESLCEISPINLLKR